MKPERPLVVDLDGSLLRGDTLHESVVANLRHPAAVVSAAWALAAHGKAPMKRRLAETNRLDVTLLPTNSAVVSLMKGHAEQGGLIYLATGADRSVADAVAVRFDMFDAVFASDGLANLTSQAKADMLTTTFGERGFDYVGNSPEDAAVWSRAERAYLATTEARPRVPRWAGREVELLSDPGPTRLRAWLKELRVHQSLKNTLLFLPLIAAHEFTNPTALLLTIAGFIAFTFMASSVYLLNDLLDVNLDRAHRTKRDRPIAAGWIRPMHALYASAGLAIAALVLGILIGLSFAVVLVLYAALTFSYSYWLKRITLVDVITLAMLYMIRIVAGAVVTGIALSFWFTGVTLFLFLCLAFVKRYAELHSSQGSPVPGRGYHGDDVHTILALGVGSGLASTLLLAIYIQSPAVSLLYPAAVVLWLVIPTVFYWIGNLWIKAGRGEMHDDPVIFALRDRASLVAAAIVLALFVAASLPATADLVERMTSAV
ncbi:UbiA family prenyltransferase [Agromyces sp. CCNWLW203]|uniref:UbiA family prenyltransferase n=1 Tax=Agromyces sp. CCNWLW203 TaxID=3112842 RepID=UPI002F961358